VVQFLDEIFDMLGNEVLNNWSKFSQYFDVIISFLLFHNYPVLERICTIRRGPNLLSPIKKHNSLLHRLLSVKGLANLFTKEEKGF